MQDSVIRFTVDVFEMLMELVFKLYSPLLFVIRMLWNSDAVDRLFLILCNIAD